MKTIGILVRQRQPGILESLQVVLDCLKKHKKTVFVDKNTQILAKFPGLEAVDTPTLAASCDLVIVIGGDGSFLHAAHDVLAHNTPMLGINRGKLGFLTDIQPDRIQEDLNAIFEGDYNIEKRFLIESHFQGKMHRALNEITLVSDNKNSMISFDIFVDDQFLLRDRSDGLIVSTPTGSTAYALSAGGPILHPEQDSLVLVPLCSHTLSSRPIVLGANHTLKIHFIENLGVVNVDGSTHHFIKANQSLEIKKHEQLLNLVHPKGYDYYDTLRTKLHWGKRIST